MLWVPVPCSPARSLGDQHFPLLSCILGISGHICSLEVGISSPSPLILYLAVGGCVYGGTVGIRGRCTYNSSASNLACDTTREQLLSLQDQNRGCGSGENARCLPCLFVPSVLSCFPCPPDAACAVEGHCPWKSCTRALVLPGFRRGRSPWLEKAVSPISSFCLSVPLWGHILL